MRVMFLGGPRDGAMMEWPRMVGGSYVDRISVRLQGAMEYTAAYADDVGKVTTADGERSVDYLLRHVMTAAGPVYYAALEGFSPYWMLQRLLECYSPREKDK